MPISRSSALIPFLLLPLVAACANEIALDEIQESPYADGYAEDGDDVEATEEDPGPDVDEDGCARFPVPGIDVVVRGTSGVLCDATVEAISGDMRVQLQRGGVSDTCHYFGVFGQSGSYEVSVWAPGHASSSQAGFIVELDACGDAITQQTTVDLVSGDDPPPVGLPPADGPPSEDPPADDPPADDPPVDDPPVDVPPVTPAVDCPAGLVAHEGSITVNDPADATLDGVQCVHGDLVLTGALDAAPVADVVFVAGDIVVDGTALGNLGDLGSLEEVAGTLRLVDNSQLGSVDLDGIAALGAIEVNGNADLTELRLQGLQTVAGDVVITDNDALDRVDLRGLQSAGGAFRLEGNQNLDQLDGDVLGSVGGDLVFEGGLFSNVDAQELTSVTGSLRLVGNADLDTLGGLQSVSNVGGSLTVRDNPILTEGRISDWMSGITVGGISTACGNDGGPACQ
jgi:hypothetical protein